jgi:hypothetical protein
MPTISDFTESRPDLKAKLSAIFLRLLHIWPLSALPSIWIGYWEAGTELSCVDDP